MPMYYVYCNALQNTRVYGTDRVYVIGIIERVHGHVCRHVHAHACV